MIIRLSKNCIKKNNRGFYFDYSPYFHSDCVIIYDENMNFILNEGYLNEEYSFGNFLSNDNDFLSNFNYEDSFDKNYCNEHNQYDEYDERDEHYSDTLSHREARICSLDFDTSYVCLIEDTLYELYALNNEGEVIILFREMELEDKGVHQYQTILEYGILEDTKVLLDLNVRKFRNPADKFEYELVLNNEDSKACIITWDYKIYIFECIYGYCAMDAFDESSLMFSINEGVRKDKYSLEELLEIERMGQSSSKGNGYVLKKAYLKNNNEKLKG